MTDEELVQAIEAQGYQQVSVEHGIRGAWVEGHNGEWRRANIKGGPRPATNEMLLRFWNAR